MKAICSICPHGCSISEGAAGLCRARGNVDGQIVDLNYGHVTAAALDPIEKKPLARFYPGSMIFSVGSYGCNFRCGFCQNHGISMCGPETRSDTVSPEQLTALAQSMIPEGNIGIAYTYNEPLIGFEFVRDTARCIRSAGMKNVVVTNGYINQGPLLELLPLIDAMNIDLKAYSESFYAEIGGSLEPVKDTIRQSAAQCHIEVTTLIVPGRNDSDEEMGALAAWLASVNPEIPLHVTRFFPRYKMADARPTEIAHLRHLVDIAGRHLKHVYAGNV